MTAADLYAQGLAAIARRRELVAAGTPVPWGDPLLVHIGEFGWYAPGSPMGETEDSEQGQADARLHVDAVNTYDLATDCLEAMLLRHLRPERVRGHWCRFNFGQAWFASHEVCPDARAALVALGVEVDG